MASSIKVSLDKLVHPVASIALRGVPQPSDNDYNEVIDRWTQTLETHGLLNIFTVRPESDGTFTVIDGNTRLFVIKEAIKRGNQKIIDRFGDGLNVMVEEKSDIDLLAGAIVGNATHRDTKPVSYAQALKKMLVISTDPEMCVEKLSSMTGLSVETINKYLGLLNLPEGVKSLVDTRAIPIQNGLGLLKLSLEDQTDPETIVKAQTLTTQEFGAEVEKIIAQERADKKAKAKGTIAQFVPVPKMLSGKEIGDLWEKAKYAYESDSSEYNRIRLEVLDEIFQADEKSIAAQRAAWEARNANADAKKKAREAKREKLKAVEAVIMLITAGTLPPKQMVSDLLASLGEEFDKEASVQKLKEYLAK